MRNANLPLSILGHLKSLFFLHVMHRCKSSLMRDMIHVLPMIQVLLDRYAPCSMRSRGTGRDPCRLTEARFKVSTAAKHVSVVMWALRVYSATVGELALLSKYVCVCTCTHRFGSNPDISFLECLMRAHVCKSFLSGTC